MVDINSGQGNENSGKKSVSIIFTNQPAVDQIEIVRKKFDDAIERNVKEVIVDFENVDYLCSTSLAELVRMKKEAVKAGATLSMTHVSAYIMEIFRTTRLLSFFQDEI